MLGVLKTSEEDPSIKSLDWQCIEPTKLEEKPEDIVAALGNKETEEDTLVLEMPPVQVPSDSEKELNTENNEDRIGDQHIEDLFRDHNVAIAMTGNIFHFYSFSISKR